jgi:hypothetical protein
MQCGLYAETRPRTSDSFLQSWPSEALPDTTVLTAVASTEAEACNAAVPHDGQKSSKQNKNLVRPRTPLNICPGLEEIHENPRDTCQLTTEF